MFGLNFYQFGNQWKYKLNDIENSKFISDRVADEIIYKSHYLLIKNLNVFSTEHDPKKICRQFLNGYTSQNVLLKHKRR